MNPDPPPEKKAGGLATNPEPHRKIKRLVRRRKYNAVRFSASSVYLQLLAERYSTGLLTPFRCSRCNRPALDPVGWNGSQRPLCEPCSDRIKPPEKPEPRSHIKGLRLGTAAELRQFANARGICVEALKQAQQMGTAKVGMVCGYPSIVLLDQSGRCMEARQVDNLKYPAIAGLDERKAHTIRGGQKNWPVGVLPHQQYLRRCRLIALVEGSADYFAALHFAITFRKEGVIPVAVLSRGIKEFHPKARRLFRGKRVRLFPHEDHDQLGVAAALGWARQLQSLNCSVDIFRFKGLRKRDGSPVKDLNDCVELAPEQSEKLQEMFP